MKATPKPRLVRSVRLPTDASGPFACSWSAVGDCAVVRVAGAIDVGTLTPLAEELRHVITTKLPRLVVDLRRVTRMEAAGLDVLADAHELAVANGGWLRASGAEQWLPELMRHTRPVAHYPNLADALPSYRRR
ncbi:STAS domain-containing protein [Kribbella sp.]|uniref:STAS domain-containing protein n=1 Tax=Kribbella sp. TaxID=1871183 RepID=UPI002D469582|nr:STAS domain-containing protein [Kribbella sp.]HZX08732.1 STAS domain-containing protein [Kribbella sp.]